MNLVPHMHHTQASLCPMYLTPIPYPYPSILPLPCSLGMSMSHLPQALSNVQDGDVFLYLKEIIINFDDGRPSSDLTLRFEDKTGFTRDSKAFKKVDVIRWEPDIYVKSSSAMMVTIQKGPFKNKLTKFDLVCDPLQLDDERALVQKDDESRASVRFMFGTSMPSAEILRVIGNQACTVLASKVSMLGNLKKVLDFLDFVMLSSGAAEPQFNTIAKAVTSIVEKVLAKFREIVTYHEQFVEIMNDLVSLLPVMELARQRIQDVECLELVKSFLAFIFETARGLNDYASTSSIEFLFRNWLVSKKDEAIKLKNRSTDLKLNVILAVGTDTRGIVSDIKGTVSNIQQRRFREEVQRVLKRVEPPTHSYFNPERCCMPGTRTTVLEAVKSFALAIDQPERLCWLYGIAGSGKSSVAASVAKELNNQKRLSGSFFCKRDVPELKDPVNLIHALIYSIAEVCETYRNIILDVLKEDSQIHRKPLYSQLEPLLKGPFGRVSKSPPHQTVIFVIDAVDECDDSRSVSILLAQIVEMAPWLRLIVTSRPLPEIEHGFGRVEQHIMKRDLFSENAHEDIQFFIRAQFSPEGPLNDLRSCMNEARIQLLSQKSSGLFIWISTVLSHVNLTYFGRHAALLEILSTDDASEPEAQLDLLYLQVLHNFTALSTANRDTVKMILAFIYVTSKNRSLPCPALYSFISAKGARLTLQELHNFLGRMGSVLTTDTQTGAIRVCHPSFLDFISNQARSKEFWMRTEDVDAMMARKCFAIMETGLRFNICRLRSATLRNDEVVDLKERIVRHVSKELQYSCIYWVDHLSRGGDACKEKMLDIVQRSLDHPRALYWLEVLSLVSELNAAMICLSTLLVMYKDNAKLRDTAHEYYRFMNALHVPMRTNTPHLYVSALLWTPLSSEISTKFYHRSLVLDGREKKWPASLQVIECSNCISCVVHSPDGSRIASGSTDGLICIWDALSGVTIGAPLMGHKSWVRSIAYSPDGLRIVSGSDDKTIRIWHALRGTPIGVPLIGHTDRVRAVAYSPEGLHIISGSDDKTIRIWDALGAAPIGVPLIGHTDRVRSVAYSPDGLRIISGSDDKTIRVWDTLGAALIHSVLEGHTGSIHSVVYSPDGSRIASGSGDKTIRIWDALRCAPIDVPFEGQLASVRSVTYSPDGSHIASGSGDKTIRIWDALRGTPIGAPLEGHLGSVFSLTYSPDGSRIVSGSGDKTIRVWDALSGARVGSPPLGRMQWVRAIAYSPDGSRIACVFNDRTIRIWDGLRGAPIGAPLEGHTESVTSVAYSPNGSRLVSGSVDKTIRIWDAQNGALIGAPLWGHKGPVWSVAYSHDGSRIVSGSGDKSVHIWDAQSGALIGAPLGRHKGSVWSVACSRDGSRIVSGSGDKTIRIWDAQSGVSIGAPLEGHTGSVTSVMFSPNGSHLVSGSVDKTVCIWDALSGIPLGKPLVGHKDSVNSVAYSPDGSCIISGSDDKTMRIWDARSGALIGVPLEGHTGSVWSVAYSPDGSRIVSGSVDKTMRIWNAQPVAQIPVRLSDDGWMRIDDERPLLWVPHEARHAIRDMSLFSIPRDAVGHPIKFDWEGLRTAWARLNND